MTVFFMFVLCVVLTHILRYLRKCKEMLKEIKLDSMSEAEINLLEILFSHILLLVLEEFSSYGITSRHHCVIIWEKACLCAVI